MLAFATDLFIQRSFDGLAKGSIYALLALALVVVFRGSGQLNFAQGEMALVCAYFAQTLTLTGFPVALAIGSAAVLGFAMGAGAERFLIRPVEKKSPIAVVVVAVGLFLGLNNLIAVIWGVDARRMPSVFPNKAEDFVRIGGAAVRIERLGIIAVMLLLVAMLWVLFNRTRIGLAMRAVANNQPSSQLVGIRVGWVLAIGWGLAGAIGAVGASMLAPQASLSGAMMFGPFIFAAAAATVGGLDSPVGAVVAGLALGLIDAYIVGYFTWIGGDLVLPVTFGIILLVLVLKPSGLFGSTRVERV
jgi:branched-chain amino acid transport system permease protein